MKSETVTNVPAKVNTSFRELCQVKGSACNNGQCSAVTASGNSPPQLRVSSRINFKQFTLSGAPVGSVGPAGWSNEMYQYEN